MGRRRLGASGGGQGPHTPVGHRALLGDSVTPHGEAHAHDCAGDEDEEDREGTDQKAQRRVEEGPATKDRKGAVREGRRPGSPQHPQQVGNSAEVSSQGLGQAGLRGPGGAARGVSPPAAPHCRPHVLAQAARPSQIGNHRRRRLERRQARDLNPSIRSSDVLRRKMPCQGCSPMWPSAKATYPHGQHHSRPGPSRGAFCMALL